MSSAVTHESLQQLARTVIAGFDRAADQYRRLSGGWELHEAPEYFCTVKIAEELAKDENTYVTLEQNIPDALNWSDRRTEAKPSSVHPDQGRFDIAVWGPGSQGILGVIEIKEVKYVTYANVQRDVQRVCDALRHTKALKWGMVAWYASLWDGDAKRGEPKSGAERLETRTAIIETKARKDAKRLKVLRATGCPRSLDDQHKGGVGRADVLVFHM